MRATIPWLVAVLGVAACTCLAQAQYPYPPYPYRLPYRPQAPNTLGPGFYAANQCGALYGPNYCVRPPFPPFNGARPNLQRSPQAQPSFPTHPFARSPRDFFMLEQ
jgi:hypothetical protein